MKLSISLGLLFFLNVTAFAQSQLQLQQQKPSSLEVALSSRLLSEVNANLQCEVTVINLREALVKAETETKEKKLEKDKK